MGVYRLVHYRLVSRRVGLGFGKIQMMSLMFFHPGTDAVSYRQLHGLRMTTLLIANSFPATLLSDAVEER